MGLRIDVLDSFATQQGQINGVRVAGPARGYRKLKYSPAGSTMDQLGSCSFELPMALRANYGLGIGTMARVTDTTWGVQGTYVVGDKSESIAADGHWVTFTLADLMEELRWGEIPGFVAQDKAFETTTTTAQRILDIANLAQPAYPWRVVFTGPDYFAGSPFQIEGGTPFQALEKLCADRFLHMRRNPQVGGGYERTLEIGAFPTNPSGIQLVRSSARPAAMNRVNIRPIPEGGLTPKASGAAIINVIVPTGAGAGWAQLTLQPLWNPATAAHDSALGYDYCRLNPFAGLNAAYALLYRRIRYDGGGIDGYEYFLVDQPSVNVYRQRWLRYPRTDIGTVSQATLDQVAAAQNLYITAVAYLLGHATPNQVLAVSTIGRGSVTGLAASTVQVYYPFTENGTQTLNINGPYYVLGVERSVSDADGTMTDGWNVSSLGQYAQSNATVLTGISQAIDNLRLGATIYPSRLSTYQDSPIDANNPVTVTVDVDPGVIAVVQAVFNVSLLPLISPVNGGTVVPHTHSTLIPAVGIDASVPYTYEGGYNPGAQAAYGHAESISANRSGGYGENISANRSGGVGKSGGVSKYGGVSKSGGVNSNNANTPSVQYSVDKHVHGLFIQGGGTPGTLDNGGYLYTHSGDKQIRATNYQQVVASTNPPDGDGGSRPGVNTDHGHADSIGVSDGIGVSDTIGVNDGLGVYKGGGLQDGLGVYKGGGIGQHGGFTPDSRFPGYSNYRTQAQTVQTSGVQSASGVLPQYGIYKDPQGQPSAVTVTVNGAQVAGPFNGAFVADLTSAIAAQLSGGAPIDVVFYSATLGRLIVRGKIRVKESVYRIG